TSTDPCTETWEATNLLTVASALTAAARAREETRGSHWREDFPDLDDAAWRGHLDTRLADGVVGLAHVPHGDTAVLPNGLVAELADAGLDPETVRAAVGAALAEDLGPGGDVTSIATIPAAAVSTADVVARADGVVAGLAVAEAVLAL